MEWGWKKIGGGAAMKKAAGREPGGLSISRERFDYWVLPLT
jgi:hypothetical protein